MKARQSLRDLARLRRHFIWVAAVVGSTLAQVAYAQNVVDTGSPCELAGRVAEREFALPGGLLGAIGRVESGRWDPLLGRIVPSPFAIDAGGQPYLKDSKVEALQQVRALQLGGARNIDVGCFQINLQNHPDAFSDLDQAFDPTANAHYAARFLASLHDRLGSWEDAVAAYHSATPALGIPYRQAVFANWAAAGDAPRLPPAPRAPVITVKVFSVDGGEVRVWSPSTSASATPAVNLAGAAMGNLPKVVTP